MPDELGELLLHCPVDDAPDARQRTREEAVRRFGADGVTTPAPAGGHRPRALAVSAVVLLLLVGFGFTPPGAAIAEDVGEWIGIGDEPSDPLPALFSTTGEVKSSDQVIGTGTTPSGVRFELAMNTSEVTEPGRRSPPFSCVYLSFPDRGVSTDSSSCLTNAALREFEGGAVLRAFPYLGPPALAEGEDVVVSVQGIPDVARMEVAYPDGDGEQTVGATLAPFEAAPAQSERMLAGDAEPRGTTALVFGVAFLPSTIFRQLPPPPEDESFGSSRGAGLDLKLDYEATREVMRQVEVTAYDAEGEVLDRHDLMQAWTSPIGLASSIPPDG